ncbi:hypothetical protein DICVIV_05742 [Dictyocaulus viviparus]|uniref:Uncharacterized protein n=1 Tax=Dictyocaulus viviparus TaxID=29172 RepID=A0A0D8XU94_DICVI|nr:hypothetical protein DICVIV_05742 [Dictyocaulus viviparus]
MSTDIVPSGKVTRDGNSAHNVNVELERSSHEIANHRAFEMDEKDIAEMSMLAAEIESAESFNLTFETVESSDLCDAEASEIRCKSVECSSPLFTSEREEIENFLTVKPNESEVEIKDANTSVADALLYEWGSPTVDREHILSEKKKQEIRRDDSTVFASTPKSREPLKNLRNSVSSIRKSVPSGKKRVFELSKEENLTPARKRYSDSSNENQLTNKRSLSDSKAHCVTSYEDKEKLTMKAKKKPLGIRNA